jgi:epoxyqueuosine reductase QueG
VDTLDINQKISRIIEKHTSNEYIIGYSYLEGLVPKKYEDLVYGISIGIKLDDKIIDGITNGPTVKYAIHYNEINSTLNDIGKDIRRMLKRKGYKAGMIKSTLSEKEEKQYPDYHKTLSVEFSHKTAATRSGMGWIGKSALFISPHFGPRVRLVTVFTDHILPRGIPVKSSLCGACGICVKKCPAQAISGKNWNPSMSREDFYDAHNCREKANELTELHVGHNDTICGICVAVCPLGKKRE